MFYLFRAKCSSFGGGLLQARIINPLHWQLGQYWSVQNPFVPFTEEIETFKFQVFDTAPHPDNYFTGNEFDLYSDRLIQALLENNQIQHELFSSEIYAKKSKKLLNFNYQVFRLTETASIIDEDRCTFFSDGFNLNRAVLHENQKDLPDFFRDSAFRHYVFISEKLKNKIEQNNITGCQFETIDEQLDRMRLTFKT